MISVDTRSLNIVSLCTGGSGLDLGLKLACGHARAVCYVEREAFACAHLVAAIDAGLLADAPLWSDLATFRGRSWRGAVDCVIGGIPCQPHSAAGKRLGRKDERDLWGDARRVIVQSGAWAVIIENVEGMLSSGGAERLWRDLGRLGFITEIGLFSAAETGAAHQRTRVFVLAVHEGRLADASRPGLQGRLQEIKNRADRRDCGRNTGLRRGAIVGDARRNESERWGSAGDVERAVRATEGEAPERQRGRKAAGDTGAGVVADAGAGGRDGRQEDAQRGEGRRTLAEWTSLGVRPPGPSDRDGWRRVIDAAPMLEPAFCRMADGVAPWLDADRIDRLRMLGNGVHPLAAAYAIRTLGARLAARGVAGAAEFFMSDQASAAR